MGKVTRVTAGLRGDAQERLHLREVPGEDELPQQSVGQDLRAVRLSRGDDLAQVSQTLRIRKDFLEAIESDCSDKLPGRTYAIGFVRAYAGYLGLDAGPLVSRYKLAMPLLEESAPHVGPAPEPAGSGSGIGWTLAALAVAGLLTYGVYQLAQPPGSASPAPQSVPASPAPQSVPAERKASVKPVARPAAAPVAAAVALAPVPKAAAAIPASGTGGQTFGAQNLNARVLLHVRALTRVLVEGADGKIYINRLLHPGDVYRVPNLVGLSLTTPDGGAVSLEVDGKDMGAAGENGRSTEALLLDPPALAERKGADTSVEGDKVTP